MRRLIVEADGGSRGNPGPAGYGAVVRDAASGEVLAEVAEAIGRATNNVSEYRGLLAGLQAALDVDPDAAVEVRMDSKLVVEQMSGRWQIKHPDLRPLASAAAGLVRRFAAGASFSWVPRSQNAHADRLANEAMDAAAEGRAWSRRVEVPEVPEPEPEPAAARSGAPNRLVGWMAPPAPPTTTVLLRHGQTPLSVERRFSGTGDAPLTAYGQEQAGAAARRLAARGGIDVVVSSPLRRAADTARAVADVVGSSEVHLDDGLRETDFGDWEGSTFAEVQDKWPAELAAWLASEEVAPPGGESFAASTSRARRALARLRARHAHRTVLVVTHVTPIKTLVRLALDAPPQALYRLHVDLCSISEIDWYDDGPGVLRLFNDAAHVADLGPAPALH